jgi:hypothetical protein
MPTLFPLHPADTPQRTTRELQHQIQAAQAAFDSQHFLLASGLLHAASLMAEELHFNRPPRLYPTQEPMFQEVPSQ